MGSGSLLWFRVEGLGFASSYLCFEVSWFGFKVSGSNI